MKEISDKLLAEPEKASLLYPDYYKSMDKTRKQHVVEVNYELGLI